MIDLILGAVAGLLFGIAVLAVASAYVGAGVRHMDKERDR